MADASNSCPAAPINLHAQAQAKRRRVDDNVPASAPLRDQEDHAPKPLASIPSASLGGPSKSFLFPMVPTSGRSLSTYCLSACRSSPEEKLPWALVIGGGGAELVAALRRPGFMAYGLGPICRHDARDDLLILFDLSIEEHVNKFSRLRARCGPS